MSLDTSYVDGLRKRSTLVSLFWGMVLVGLLGLGGWGLWMWSYARSPGPAGSDSVMVYIPPRSSFAVIRRKLAETGVIADDHRFYLLGRLLGVTQSLKAGEYSFGPDATPYTILRDLQSGRVLKRVVTLPEGANLSRAAEILAAENLIDREHFLALTRDAEVLRELKVRSASLEGYLFPDTYYFSRGEGAIDILRVMVERTRQVLSELLAQGQNELHLSPHDILTLASIVEKESALVEERPLIARVFLNRLRRHMRLQADPTVIYGLGEVFDGNLRRRDLKTPSPYNTYMIKGLPPGPIANPGRESIAAVLHPADGPYLYFVSKNDGSHFFSKSLAEHNRAVRKYQKRKRTAR